MPQFLVTYDLKETPRQPHREFILAAEKEDLLYVYKCASGSLYRLTNTTLWGDFKDKDEVRAAFERALAASGKKLGVAVILEKRVITQIFDSYFRSDKVKVPDSKLTGATDFETCRNHQLKDPFFAY